MPILMVLSSTPVRSGSPSNASRRGAGGGGGALGGGCGAGDGAGGPMTGPASAAEGVGGSVGALDGAGGDGPPAGAGPGGAGGPDAGPAPAAGRVPPEGGASLSAESNADPGADAPSVAPTPTSPTSPSKLAAISWGGRRSPEASRSLIALGFTPQAAVRASARTMPTTRVIVRVTQRPPSPSVRSAIARLKPPVRCRGGAGRPAGLRMSPISTMRDTTASESRTVAGWTSAQNPAPVIT